MGTELKLTDAIKQVVEGADSDAVYDRLCPVSPGQYQFSRPEKDKDGKEKPLKPFEEAWPEYLTRGKFRQKVEDKRIEMAEKDEQSQEWTVTLGVGGEADQRTKVKGSKTLIEYSVDGGKTWTPKTGTNGI